MIRIFLALFLFANVAWAACTKINMPTDYAVVTNGTRANLKANFSETQNRVNPCMDSVDEVRGRMSGYTGSFTLTSLEHLRLRLDGDASTSGTFLVESSTGDSLLRVKEDSSVKVFGPLAVAGRTTLSDSLIAISARWTGNLAAANGTYSGTLGAAGIFTGTASGGGASSGIISSSAAPSFALRETDAAADNGWWDISASSEQLRMRAVNDANSSSGNFMTVDRTGTTIDNVTFPGTSVIISSLAGTGTRIVTSTSTGVQGNATTIDGANAWTGKQTLSGSGPSVLDVVSSQPGDVLGARIRNASNSISSDSRLLLDVAGTSAGDAYVMYSVTGGSYWTAGVDNSDGDAFAISLNGIPGVDNKMKITAAGAVSMPGPLAVTGAATAATVALGGNEAFDYDEGTFVATLTGVVGTVTVTAYYVRVGKSVTLHIPSLSGTSNTAACTITGVPAPIRPTRNQRVSVPVIYNNSVEYTGHITVLAGGSGEIYLDYRTSATAYTNTFTSSGDKGLVGSTTVTYSLQ